MTSFLLNIFDLLFILFFVGSFCEFRNLFIVGIISIAFALFENFIELYVDIHFYMYVLIVIDLVYVLIVFKQPNSKKILCFIMAYFIFVVSKLLSTLCLEATNVVPSLLESNIYELILRFILTQIFQYSFGLLLIHYYRKNKEIKWIFITMIPMLILLIVTVPNHKYWYELFQNKDLFSFTITMLVLIVFAFIFQTLLMYNTRVKRELEKEKVEREFLEKRYELMFNQYKSNFEFLHSMLHEVSVLNKRLWDHDFSAAEYSAKNLETIVYDTFNNYYTNNVALSIVLSTYKFMLNELSVSTNITVYNDIFSKDSLSEQVELYSNLFDFIISNIKKGTMLNINGESNSVQDILKVEFEIKNDDEVIQNLFQFTICENNRFKGLIIKDK